MEPTTKAPPVDIDVDLDGPETTALQRTQTPVHTLTGLSALKGEAVEVIGAATQVLTTLRNNGLRMLHPTDCLSFKHPNGQVTVYVQDCGTQRFRDLFGIEIYNVSEPVKVQGTTPGDFMYIVRGDGRSKFTGQRVENIEGGRSSTDDFCKGVTGPALELLVRKAARANLDGNITRMLSGTKNIAVEDLERNWVGTGKSIDHITKGRGWGLTDARAEMDPTIPPPVCKVCNTTAVLRAGQGGRPAFWGCPKWKSHEDRKWTQDAADWARKQKAQPPAQTAAAQPQPQRPAAPAPPAEDRKCDACGKVESQHDSADHDFLGD